MHFFSKLTKLFKNLFLVIIFFFSCKQETNYVDNPKPNIIFVYVDDLGYGDLGNFWQNQRTGDRKMITPHLDALANEGAMLTHHYAAAPVCAPARASLLEGLHQGHSSVRDNQFDKPIKKGLTLAEMLRKSGYHTMHVGKAGLAGKRGEAEPYPKTLPAHPLKRGFDQFYGYLYHIQGHQHFPQNGITKQRAYFTDGYTNILTGTDLTYTTDVFTAKSKQWIADHETAYPEQPFFLYLAYDTPHAALQVPTQAYPSGGGLKGGVQWTSESSSTPWVNTASGERDSFIHPDYANKDWNDTVKRHATMIRRIDDAIADLIQLLKDLNIDDNTMIIFSSDNGPHHEGGSGGQYIQDPQFFQSYANMNGTKRDMWEAGIRVPTICRYPGVIPEKSEVTFPSGQWDWLATFADLADVAIPQYTDGVSLMPSLTKIGNNQIDKGYTYHEYNVGGNTLSYEDFEVSKRDRFRGQMQVIRMGDYKGVRYDIKDHVTTPFEIYNVVTDAREHYNLADSMPELQRDMMEKVLQVRKSNPTTARPYDLELIPSKTLVSPIKGLMKSIFLGKHQWVPNFEYLSPQSTIIVSGLDTDSKLPSEFGLFYTGYIKIPEDGLYTFYLESASKCHIMLHDIHLLDNDYNYTSEELSAQLYLKSGYHPIRISYQQNATGEPSILLKLEGPNRDKGIIPRDIFFVEELEFDK